MNGYYEITGKTEIRNNCLVSGFRGPTNVIFKDGQHIRFGVPSFRLGGLVGGERSVQLIGSCTFEDLTNHRKAVILNSTYRANWLGGYTGNKDELEGVIYNSKQLTGDAKSIKNNYSKDIKFVTDIESPTDCR